MKWKITSRNEIMVQYGAEWRCVGRLVACGNTILFMPVPGYEHFDTSCLIPQNKAA